MKKIKTCHTTGFGFDSHAFSKKGTLVLGGLPFPGLPRLKGHSDGDALIHAVIDALLGGASLGDIGEMFPDNQPVYKGISSSLLLKQALKKVLKKGFVPLHIDVTVLAERPRLSSRKNELRRYLARVLERPFEAIHIKGKTPEGLRLFSSSGGIAVWAVATLTKKS